MRSNKISRSELDEIAKNESGLMKEIAKLNKAEQERLRKLEEERKRKEEEERQRQLEVSNFFILFFNFW